MFSVILIAVMGVFAAHEWPGEEELGTFWPIALAFLDACVCEGRNTRIEELLQFIHLKQKHHGFKYSCISLSLPHPPGTPFRKGCVFNGQMTKANNT